MKGNGTKLMIIGVLALAANFANAEVKGWSAIIGSMYGQFSFTVPTGKTFVLQQVLVASATQDPLPSAPYRFFVDVNGAPPFFPMSLTNEHRVFEPPLYFQENMRFGNGGSSNVCFLLVGLLADSTDLFVSKTEATNALYACNFTDVKAVGGSAALKLDVATPRPVNVKLFKSTDLKTWSVCTNALIARLSSARQYQVNAPTWAGSGFFKAQAFPR